MAEVASLFDVHRNQITTSEAQLLEGAEGVFGPGWSACQVAPAVHVKTLHVKIGEPTLAGC